MSGQQLYFTNFASKEILFYLKIEARRGFVNHAKEGLEHILAYENISNHVRREAQTALKNLLAAE